LSKGGLAPKYGKIVNHGEMNDFRTMIYCFALLVGWKEGTEGREVWREGVEVWRGGIGVCRGGMEVWRGGIGGWREGLEVWRGGMEVWRGGMVYPLKEWKIAPDLGK